MSADTAFTLNIVLTAMIILGTIVAWLCTCSPIGAPHVHE